MYQYSGPNEHLVHNVGSCCRLGNKGAFGWGQRKSLESVGQLDWVERPWKNHWASQDDGPKCREIVRNWECHEIHGAIMSEVGWLLEQKYDPYGGANRELG
ncbi:hypothetical protein VNO78_08346 [Psophocarpus tetragonolobus]|uniref:Uncharacterized protein n=1 Tax=Psophocarpus tetragonolobus TaxID=3891 RepID=A0AAN9XTN2_PSOTE